MSFFETVYLLNKWQSRKFHSSWFFVTWMRLFCVLYIVTENCVCIFVQKENKLLIHLRLCSVFTLQKPWTTVAQIYVFNWCHNIQLLLYVWLLFRLLLLLYSNVYTYKGSAVSHIFVIHIQGVIHKRWATQMKVTMMMENLL